MKKTHYISIQGRYAPSFWFKNQDAHSFRSLVESITLSRSLIISSIYRSDLFYCSDDDKSDLIIRIWCSFKGHHFDDHIKGKFIRADSKPDAFEFYFDTLFHLMLHPPHYERYKERLNEIQQQEKNNSILNELMQCDLHLSECYKAQEVDYKQLAKDAESVQASSVAYTEFGTLAKRRIKDLNYN